MDVLRDPSSSLFEFINGLNKGHAFANTRRSLQVISREIETAVSEGKIRARIFAGFQSMRFFLPQVNQYQQLASVAETIWVFGVQDVLPPQIPNVVYVPLAETDRLAQEWFVVVDAPEYFSALTAQDLSSPYAETNDHNFRGIWTFEPEIIRQADKWLSRTIGVVEADIDLTGRDYSRQLYQIGHTVENLINDLELRNIELERTQLLTHTLTDLIVHDINNPLAVIQSCLDLIDMAMTHGKPESVTKHTHNAKASMQEVQGLITDLLEVSRMEAGELKLEFHLVEVSEMVESILGRFVEMANLQGKAISAEITPNLLVYGDRGMLIRVLTNLVGNAFKFTARGGQISISAKPGPNAESVTISVKDNGQGIAKDQQKRIFEKFGQIQGKPGRSGFGLGLTFCRMCVEAHGGQINVESSDGNGALFQFTLRAASIEASPAQH